MDTELHRAFSLVILKALCRMQGCRVQGVVFLVVFVVLSLLKMARPGSFLIHPLAVLSHPHSGWSAVGLRIVLGVSHPSTTTPVLRPLVISHMTLGTVFEASCRVMPKVAEKSQNNCTPIPPPPPVSQKVKCDFRGAAGYLSSTITCDRLEVPGKWSTSVSVPGAIYHIPRPS